jgi:hypothetical protein
VSKHEGHEDFALERELLPKIAVAILNEDLDAAEGFLG